MAELKDFGVVKSWYEAYKKVNTKKEPVVNILPDDGENLKEQDEVATLKAEIERLKGELQKKDLEVKKKDAETNVLPNPETGEVPLRVGFAQSIMDKKKKEEVAEKEEKEKKEKEAKSKAGDKIKDMVNQRNKEKTEKIEKDKQLSSEEYQKKLVEIAAELYSELPTGKKRYIQGLINKMENKETKYARELDDYLKRQLGK